MVEDILIIVFMGLLGFFLGKVFKSQDKLRSADKLAPCECCPYRTELSVCRNQALRENWEEIDKMMQAQDKKKRRIIKTVLELEMEERERHSNSVPKSWKKKNIFDDKGVAEAINEAIKQKKKFYD